MAQRYFDQGLALYYAFEDAEATRSFEAAAAADPGCLMAFWGIAIANGPSLNSRWHEAGHVHAALAARVAARKLKRNASAVEQALSEALDERLADPLAVAGPARDAAYARAMRRVWRDFPDDPDVGALTAESIMAIRPWEYWTPEGKPESGTEEAIGILQDVLARWPSHPYALHLFVHAVEASPCPQKARCAADGLRNFAPELAHLLHMPSHIDVRLGQWEDAIAANEKAIAAANRRPRLEGDPYNNIILHNHCMLIYAAMMRGEEIKATRMSRAMLSLVPTDIIKDIPEMVDGFFSTPYEVELRFGRWRDVLTEPKPRESFRMTTAFWHYARGVAFAATGRVDEALAEEKQLTLAVTAIPKEARFRRNLIGNLLEVASTMLRGEILFRQGNSEPGIRALREAVRMEDGLKYSEPPEWLVPMRHVLGATLMRAHKYREAEAVYEGDLARHPENGWALYGLARSLKMQSKDAEAAAVAARFERAWKHANVKITSSCCCLPDEGPGQLEPLEDFSIQ